MDRAHAVFGHGDLQSVVVNNFNVQWAYGRPYEANAPLLVDADAMLAFPVSEERFQAVARGRLEKVQCGRAVQHLQLSCRYVSNVGELLAFASLKQFSRLVAVERLN